MFKTDDYDFTLPEELIAQTPLKDRDSSRLLVLDRENKSITDKHFYDIIDYLEKDDLLIMNNSRVIPARLFGVKDETKATVEVLLLKEVEVDCWETLVKPDKRIKEGTIISFGDGLLKMQCYKLGDEGIRYFRLVYKGILLEVLEKLGTMPLPPYIKEKLTDQERYQTVYSKVAGSAAAPTAGLHFTKELMAKLQAKGVKIAYLTLHVGLGTFRPVSVDDINDHKMHSEFYQLDDINARIINEAIEKKSKIVAVGTTSVRTMETIAHKYNKIKACSGYTDIFIYPRFEFKVISGLITNFHLPKSTLMMLVSAFANKDLIMKAYAHAIEEKYRFFSFGDSMYIK
jgi:S-adenosylmethionine:tRNA ribosyltransferase-isomerase